MENPGLNLIERKTLVVTPDEHSFRVYQWNILADGLSASSPTENFCAVPPECLKWSYRSSLILKQIESANADVICLEEVDHFDDFLQPELKKIGYDGFFVPREDSPCLNFPNNNGPEGVAIFYRTSRFSLKDTVTEFLLEENEKKGKRVLFMLLLEHVGLRKTVVVATTHLKAKRDFVTRRLVQAESAIDILKKHAVEKPVVWCGDFNGEPNEPFYKAIKSCSLNLESAYSKALGEEPKFTTWKIRPKKEEKHTIDYIWYSKDSLKLNSVLLPMLDEEAPETRFPSLNHASDHIALCADFSLI